MPKPLIFDLETIARPAAVAQLPEPEAPSNWKDPAKIEAEKARKRAEQLEHAALDIDTAQIVALGFQHYPQGEIVALVVGVDVPDEAALLERLWHEVAVAGGIVAGYNVIAFDLALALSRSMALGVRPPLVPRLNRYQVGPVYDLMTIRYPNAPAKGLRTVARLYDIPNPMPDLDGSQVAAMDAGTLRAYVSNDVRMTAALWRLMDGVYWPSDDRQSDQGSLRRVPELVAAGNGHGNGHEDLDGLGSLAPVEQK